MLNATDLNKIMAIPLACEYGDTGTVEEYRTNMLPQQSRTSTAVEEMRKDWFPYH